MNLEAKNTRIIKSMNSQPTWQCPKCCSTLPVISTIWPWHVIPIIKLSTIFIRISVTNIGFVGFRWSESLKTYCSRSPCAAYLRTAVLSTRLGDSATCGTIVVNSCIEPFNLSRRFFSARFLASRPLKRKKGKYHALETSENSWENLVNGKVRMFINKPSWELGNKEKERNEWNGDDLGVLGQNNQ